MLVLGETFEQALINLPVGLGLGLERGQLVDQLRLTAVVAGLCDAVRNAELLRSRRCIVEQHAKLGDLGFHPLACLVGDVLLRLLLVAQIGVGDRVGYLRGFFRIPRAERHFDDVRLADPAGAERILEMPEDGPPAFVVRTGGAELWVVDKPELIDDVIGDALRQQHFDLALDLGIVDRQVDHAIVLPKCPLLPWLDQQLRPSDIGGRGKQHVEDRQRQHDRHDAGDQPELLPQKNHRVGERHGLRRLLRRRPGGFGGGNGRVEHQPSPPKPTSATTSSPP